VAGGDEDRSFRGGPHFLDLPIIGGRTMAKKKKKKKEKK
jgi:hypothetical protein